MAKVSKSVREKRKDFAKTKLKVGKSKQLPANHTDTTFRTKAVVLPKQSVTQEATVKEARSISHYLALLSHKSGDIRRDALQQLTAHLTAHPPHLSTIITPILQAISPLIIDDTSSVRAALLELFRSVLRKLPGRVLNAHTDHLLLYISSAMTHISPSIRADSTRFLEWSIAHMSAAETIVTKQFEKFLNNFSTLLGWTGQNTMLSNGKALANHLNVFSILLAQALNAAPGQAQEVTEFVVPFMLDQDFYIAHRGTDRLNQSCQTLDLFHRDTPGQGADVTNFDLLAPHMTGLAQYLSNKFTDSANADGQLCLPVLKVVSTLFLCPQAQTSKPIASVVAKIARSFDNLQESAGSSMPQGLIGEWRVIQDYCPGGEDDDA